MTISDADPIDRLNWLRDHMIIIDQSEPESFESIVEAVVSVVQAAYTASGYSEVLRESLGELERALAGRTGTGSALRG